MAKIYLVKCFRGSWDDYVEWECGIYDNKEMAEALVDKINQETEEVKNNWILKNEDGDFCLDYNTATEEDHKNFERLSYGPARVFEYELNQEII